jgi:hypothetical protein
LESSTPLRRGKDRKVLRRKYQVLRFLAIIFS